MGIFGEAMESSVYHAPIALGYLRSNAAPFLSESLKEQETIP